MILLHHSNQPLLNVWSRKQLDGEGWQYKPALGFGAGRT